MSPKPRPECGAFLRCGCPTSTQAFVNLMVGFYACILTLVAGYSTGQSNGFTVQALLEYHPGSSVQLGSKRRKRVFRDARIALYGRYKWQSDHCWAAGNRTVLDAEAHFTRITIPSAAQSNPPVPPVPRGWHATIWRTSRGGDVPTDRRRATTEADSSVFNADGLVTTGQSASPPVFGAPAIK